MPSCHIIRETKVNESFRVKQIRGMFDLSAPVIRHEWKSSLPYEDRPWKIGLVVGPSGSGKTTLGKELFDMPMHDGFEWRDDCAVVDCFRQDIPTKAIFATLNAVGFSSPPHWLKPYSHLSNGQKFRVELARCLLESDKGVVFDEFTSVVDRDVAKIGCAAISKAIRKQDSPPFVALSCHYDIIDWLDPDWIFDVGTQQFDWRDRRRFPEIDVRVYRASTAAWRMFREHHYLSHVINKSAQCFVAKIGDKPVGFTSYVHFPHPKSKIIKMEHRTVVLPDFQGVGIGNRLSEFIGQHVKSLGFRFLSTTSSPNMIHHRAKSKLWKTKRVGRSSSMDQKDFVGGGFRNTSSQSRITGGFEFVGV